MFTRLPSGRRESARLNAEFRMRVATRISSTKGELAIENVCVRPSEPSGAAPRRARSIACPALKRKVRGLSNWKATVSAQPRCDSAAYSGRQALGRFPAVRTQLVKTISSSFVFCKLGSCMSPPCNPPRDTPGRRFDTTSGIQARLRYPLAWLSFRATVACRQSPIKP